MVPPLVLEECRTKAAQLEAKPTNWIAAGVIVALWLSVAGAAIYWLWP
jgi:hypothetical protein